MSVFTSLLDTNINGEISTQTEAMWTSIPTDTPGPPARSKHSATLVNGQLILLGGRNGNVPLKDLWSYVLAEGKWRRLTCSGDSPPCLQEHSAVGHRGELFVFGGEVGFASTETPLWVFNLKDNRWRKIRTHKGCAAPKGRRGHCALVFGGHMFVHGGYQDLKGSSNELWAFHFESESWRLLWPRPGRGEPSEGPPARHKHSAVVHGQSMWIYGGMTDLQERQDCWKWDTITHTWSCLRTKISPGPLHSHAACRLPGAMLLFGGENNGKPTNELWKLHYATETWERLQILGQKPQPRAESVALAVSPLHLKPQIDITSNDTTPEHFIDERTTSNRHGSYLPNNRVCPSNGVDTGNERTYVFKPATESGGFLKEISKLSQINISRLSHNTCSYSVLTSTNEGSMESLITQNRTEENSPTKMVKSQSAHIINKRKNGINSPMIPENSVLNSNKCQIPREPISVPNFRALTLTTPVLTPVEVSRLVFLDSDDEDSLNNDIFDPPPGDHDIIQVKPAPCDFATIHKLFQPQFLNNSYYENIPVPKSASVRFQEPESETRFMEDNESTSDYASIEAVNKLGCSNYSLSKNNKNLDSPFGFCNPNYMGPDINDFLDKNDIAKLLHTPDSLLEDRSITSRHIARILQDSDRCKNVAKMLNTPDSLLEDQYGRSTSRVLHPLEEMVELKCLNQPTARGVSSRQEPPNSLNLDHPNPPRARAKSAGRSEAANVPIFIYVVGGKEQQATVFQKPLSVWRLEL